MNVELVSPMSLLACLSAGRTERGGAPRAGPRKLWRILRDRVGEELRYVQARIVLNRLDDRDLDDLALGRGDLPGLARAHARAAGRH